MNIAAVLQAFASIGHCPSLINDDAGHWAVSCDGIQTLPIDPPCDIETAFFIGAEQWRKTPQEAVEEYLRCFYGYADVEDRVRFEHNVIVFSSGVGDLA